MFSEISLRAIQCFPAHIAMALRDMQQRVDVEAQAKLLGDVVTHLLEYQACIVAAEYQRSGLQDDDLDQLIEQDFARPLISTWSEFLRLGFPRLIEAGHEFFIPELPKAHSNAETARPKGKLVSVPGKGFYDDHGEFVQTQSRLGLVGALIAYRNKFFHGQKGLEEDARREFAFYLDVLDLYLTELDWMTRYPLLRQQGPNSVVLMGTVPSSLDLDLKPAVPDGTTALFYPEHSVWLGIPHPLPIPDLVHSAGGDFAFAEMPADSSTQLLEGNWLTRAIDRFPYPIVLPLRELRQKTDVEAKTKILVDVLTQLLKYQAIVLQSEYLRSELIDEELTKIMRRDLSRPLVSAWTKFIEAACPRLANAGHVLFVPELCQAHARSETKRPDEQRVLPPGTDQYDEEGELIDDPVRLGLVRALVSYRNKFAHGLSQPEAESCKEFHFYLEVLKDYLSELEWMTEHPLLKRENGMVHRLMGHTPEPSNDTWPKLAGDTGLALLSGDGARILPLFPLFIVPQDYVAATGEGEDLLVYDQSTGKRVIYASPRGHHRELQGTMRQWRQLVEAKQVVLPELTPADLSAEEIGNRASRITADAEELLFSSQKIIKGLYVRCEDPERHLRFFPGTTFPLALVTAHAGAGKTSLLHHMADEWRSDGKSVVLLRGVMLRHADIMQNLRELLRLGPGVSAVDLATHGASAERPIVVILDGLNEHGRREQLLRSLLEFAEQVQESRSIKILLSWRNDAADWAGLAKSQSRLFLPAPESAAQQTDAIPALALGPWSHADVEALWTKLQRKDKKRYSPKFRHADVYEKNRSVADLLKNPLLLRLFLAGYAGQKLPLELSRREILRHWMQQLGKRTGDANGLLLNIARICTEQRATQIELDALYQDTRTAEEVRRTDIAAPFNRLLRKEGVISQIPGDPVTITFTMDVFLEQAAGTALIADGSADSPEALIEAYQNLEGHPLQAGITETALTHQTRQIGRDYLWDFIDSAPASDESARIAGELLGRIIEEIEDPDVIAKELTDMPSELDLVAASYAADYLQVENQFKMAIQFLKMVIEEVWAKVEPSEAFAFLLISSARAARINCQLQLFSYWGQKSCLIYKELFGDWSVPVARALTVVGQGFQEEGDYQSARQSFERGLAINLKLFGEEHADVATNYNNLGSLLQDLGENQQARVYYEKSLAIDLKLFGEEHEDVATSYNNLGSLLSDLGENQQARDYYEKSLAIKLKLFGEESKGVATSYNNLGSLLQDLGENQQARDYYEKSLAIRLKLFGEEHADVAACYNSLGSLLSDLGENQQARDYFEKSLAIKLKRFGEEHADVATSYNNLGSLLSDLGENQQARDYYEKSLAIRLKLFGEEHADVATSYNNLGALLSDLGENEQARDYYEKSLAIRLKLFGEEHADVATSYNSLGVLLSVLGENQQARDYFEKSLAIRLKLFGEEHTDVARCYSWLGGLLSDLGENQQARGYHEKCLAIHLKLFGEEHADVANSYNNLGSLLSDLGENEQARDYYEKSLAIRLKLFGEEHADVATSYNNLGVLLSDLGENEQARDYYEKSLAIRLKRFGEEHKGVASSYSLLGGVLWDLEQNEQARECYEKSLAIRLKLFGAEHADVASSYSLLGGVLWDLEQNEQARECYEKSLAIRLKLFGEEHADVANSYRNLGSLLSDLGENEQARDYYEKSLAIDLKLFGEEHADLATSYSNLGNLLSDLGENEQARDYYEKSLAIDLKLFGEESEGVASIRDMLGDTLLLLSQAAEAEKQYRLAAIAGNQWAMMSLGKILLESESLDLQREAVQWIENAMDADNEEATELAKDLSGLNTNKKIQVVRERLAHAEDHDTTPGG